MNGAAPDPQPRQRLLMPGVRLEHSAQWVSLAFDRPRPCLSSAPVNGGLGLARRWLNLRVDGEQGEGLEQPALTVAQLCRRQGWPEETPAMMTAASMDSLRVRQCRLEAVDLAVVVTVGLANARRAGDPAEFRQLGEQPRRVGTINLAVITGGRLEPAVMVESMLTLTEAKAAVLQELGVRSPVSGGLATGTGTDAVAIFAGDGPEVSFAGKHTVFGEQLAHLTMDAIRCSVTEWEGRP